MPSENKNTPKAVFVAHLGCAGASGRQRLWALRQCGVEVESLDKDAYRKNSGRLKNLLIKLSRNPSLSSRWRDLEHDLIELCKKTEPDLIWMEWPKEFESSLFRKLRELPKIPFLVSFQDDNPWGERSADQWMWKRYFKIIPEFDIHLVKRPEDKDRIRELGGKASRLWEHGAYSPLFHPGEGKGAKTYPVSFVGTCMDGREKLVGLLLEQGLPIHVFGTHWEKRSDLPKRYPDNFHPAVRAEQYADVLRQSGICLGLVSHSNRDEWTMRTYEVPACGSLLLAERTPTHEKWFEEGREIVLFSDNEECASAVKKLLSDEGRRDEIASAGSEKICSKPWALEERMREFLNSIRETARMSLK
ncbi:glycosyltransferase [Luteolibacter yonseiensis]|uniref:Glycosyltransferase n=1 Tax=Luteolibacter yonseiensis TaxID=1144680 RepID=A0A934VBD0_9BACT|nr:glycosyltransferase [Luteolibacter yonseiensis]MBK1817133.1 glycosyltransferase [Luteolibacter yonseiensis]